MAEIDPRVRRRGVRFTPRRSHVREARHWVRLGLPIHPRWLPFLTPAERLAARLTEEPR